MKKRLTSCAVLLTFGLTAQSSSPEVVASSGSDYSNASMQMSCTIGETIITTVSDPTTIMTQGFHQTHLSSVSIQDLNPEIVFKAYPSPVIHQLTIENSDEVIGSEIHVKDENGREVWSGRVEASTSTIDFSSYAPGTYFLSLDNEGSVIKTFKILKIK